MKAKARLLRQVLCWSQSSLETGATDEAQFDITITFASQLPVGTDLTKDDLAVTPIDDPDTTEKEDVAKIKGQPAAQGLDRSIWEVEVQPVKGMDTTVDLSDAGKVKFTTATGYTMLTVKTKGGCCGVDC